MYYLILLISKSNYLLIQIQKWVKTIYELSIIQYKQIKKFTAIQQIMKKVYLLYRNLDHSEYQNTNYLSLYNYI